MERVERKGRSTERMLRGEGGVGGMRAIRERTSGTEGSKLGRIVISVGWVVG